MPKASLTVVFIGGPFNGHWRRMPNDVAKHADTEGGVLFRVGREEPLHCYQFNGDSTVIRVAEYLGPRGSEESGALTL